MRNELIMTEFEVRVACIEYAQSRGFADNIGPDDVGIDIGVYDYGDCVEFEGATIDLSDSEPGSGRQQPGPDSGPTASPWPAPRQPGPRWLG